MTEKHNNFTRIDFANIAEMLAWRATQKTTFNTKLFAVVHGVPFELQVRNGSGEGHDQRFYLEIRVGEYTTFEVATDDISQLFAITKSDERVYHLGCDMNGNYDRYYDIINQCYVDIEREE